MARLATRDWLKDWAAALAATYLSVTLGGTLSQRLLVEPASRIAGWLAALLLLALYATLIGVGLRSHWTTYLAAGIVCPLILMLLAVLPYAIPVSYDVFTLTEAMLAGFSVGVRMTGSPDPALGAIMFLGTFLLWWLGIIAAALIPVAVRRALGRASAA